MKLSPGLRVLVGMVTLWPIVWLLIFLIFGLRLVLQNDGPNMGALAIFIVGHGITAILAMGMLVFYVLHAHKNEKISKDLRVVWIVFLVTAGLFAQPIYYVLYVFGQDDSESSTMRRASQRTIQR